MVDELAIATTYVPHLKTQFSRGSVVLFTGAGFSLEAVAVAGNRVPDSSALISSLWSICYPAVALDPSTQLQDIYDAAIQANRRAVEDLMKRSFTVDSRQCPDFYTRLLTMPWARIYTLNVDDLAEKILADNRVGRPVRALSATSGNIAELHDEGLSIVHLNGFLGDVPNNVTFSRYQYSLRAGSDPFYEMLRHDLMTRPVVFIGSSLEEGQMWQHLALRGAGPKRGETELRPRSYLVTPQLNRSKEALLSKYKVVLIQKTTEQFCVDCLDGMPNERAAGIAFTARVASQRSERGPRILRLTALPPGSAEATEYLLGAEPEWVDATRNRIAHRACFDEIMEQIARIRAGSSAMSFLIVTGTAGTGKSSAMMVTALRLEAEGVPTGWVDAAERFDLVGFREAIKREQGLGALFISNADLSESRLSRHIRDALECNPRLVIVCECRSSRMDRILDRVELGLIAAEEYTIPFLIDSDIEAILQVLDRENRLGLLKGMDREARRRVFQAEAGRQMLVAMYKATHGVDFKQKIVTELNGLSAIQKFVYGLVCVAHSHRFFLERDEIAIACGDDIDEWPRALDALVRRKIVLLGAGESYKARHREISQFVYDELNTHGAIADIVRALIRVAATKTTAATSRSARSSKMLATFTNHGLVRRTVGPSVGRQIYSEFEQLLQWNYHYWLHRGAMELETGNLGLAENFLRQAKSIEPNDMFIDNELAYLNFRKANESPRAAESQPLVDDAIKTLEDVAARRPDQRPRAFHILGSQGLRWSRVCQMSATERQRFISKLLGDVRSVLNQDTDNMLSNLEQELRRELLSMAVAPPETPHAKPSGS